MAFYEKGLALLEKERRMAVLPTMKESLMKKAYDQYEEAAVFAIERGFPEKAFFIVEGMKARGFLDLLSEGLVDLEKDVPLELKQHRDEIENRLSMLRKRRLGEAQKEAPDEAEIASITNSVTKTEAELEDLQNHIRLRNAAYASVQYPEPVTVGELQKIIKPDEVILEYFLSKKKAYCFMTKPDVFNVVTLPAETGEIERQVKMWLLAITSSARVGERASGTPLYSSLISPAGQLINGKSLIVIPDGILARLPFETIPIATGKKMTYLLYTCPVKYVQSASVLKLLRTQYRKDGTNNSFIGFGDPVYDYESFIAGRPEKGGSLKGFKEELDIACLTRDGYTRVGGKLNRLEGSGKEVQDIAGLFREKNLVEKVNIRLDAKEEYAKADDIKNYGYIHFSAHGVLNDRFQAIALSLIPGGTEDGFLTLSDIIRCHYNARLVVLSACETGLGRAERGEGVVGLTRAVMYAGTPAAVVSLWDVSDIETTKLMTLLYSHLLKDGMSKEDALRAAKMDMQKSKNSEHPYFWGAFVMYGE